MRRLMFSCAAAAALFVAASVAAPANQNWHGQQQNNSWNRGDNHGDNRGDNRGNTRGDNRGDNHGFNQGHGDRDWRDDRGSWHRDHDRYWQRNFGNRGFIARDRIFFELKRQNYMRFTGEPYWFQGRYVVRSFDRRGRPVIVEINPYTGQVIGVVRF